MTTAEHPRPIFPILGVFRLNGQPKRDGSIIVRSCKASQSPVYPIRDAFAVVEHPSCPSSSSLGKGLIIPVSSGGRLWKASGSSMRGLVGRVRLETGGWWSWGAGFEEVELLNASGWVGVL